MVVLLLPALMPVQMQPYPLLVGFSQGEIEFQLVENAQEGC